MRLWRSAMDWCDLGEVSMRRAKGIHKLKLILRPVRDGGEHDATVLQGMKVEAQPVSRMFRAFDGAIGRESLDAEEFDVWPLTATFHRKDDVLAGCRDLTQGQNAIAVQDSLTPCISWTSEKRHTPWPSEQGEGL